MTIIIATDLGKPVPRPFTRLATASNNHFGSSAGALTAQVPRIWAVEEDHAYVLGVTNPKAFSTTSVQIPPGTSPEQCILDMLRQTGYDNFTVQPMNIPPGCYFPRIARPHHQHPGDFPTPFYADLEFAHEEADANLQIGMLANRLRRCFEVVAPVQANFHVFGGEFRNILLLAATEVEAQWKGILKANAYNSARPSARWSTNDYIKTEAACRLADFAVEFPEYPWIEPVAPFRGWTAAAPTTSLPWYEAYNSVKHDREQHGGRATLICALEAVAAVVVVAVAQFGISFVRRGARWKDLFQMHTYPQWEIGDTHGWRWHPGSPLPEERLQYPFG